MEETLGEAGDVTEIMVDRAGSYLLLVTCLAMDILSGGGCEPVETEDGFHWVFKTLEETTMDPWELGMQVSGGHQLCSVHCLLMELFPEYRKKTCPEDAYGFVSSKLPKLLRSWLRRAGGKTRRQAKRLVQEMHPGEELPRAFFGEDNILTVLGSRCARRYVPTWK